jgi:hypothetical protein
LTLAQSEKANLTTPLSQPVDAAASHSAAMTYHFSSPPHFYQQPQRGRTPTTGHTKREVNAEVATEFS